MPGWVARPIGRHNRHWCASGLANRARPVQSRSTGKQSLRTSMQGGPAPQPAQGQPLQPAAGSGNSG
eukprot:6841877-Prorocentrum_lima.AAC.1